MNFPTVLIDGWDILPSFTATPYVFLPTTKPACASLSLRKSSVRMTSRLKHKLELENINLKSAYLNESFVQVGLSVLVLPPADPVSCRLVRRFLRWRRQRRTSSSMCRSGNKRLVHHPSVYSKSKQWKPIPCRFAMRKAGAGSTGLSQAVSQRGTITLSARKRVWSYFFTPR
jgi:hypothetical protein